MHRRRMSTMAKVKNWFYRVTYSPNHQLMRGAMQWRVDSILYRIQNGETIVMAAI